MYSQQEVDFAAANEALSENINIFSYAILICNLFD